MNVTAQISAVDRQVGSRTLAAGEARVVTIAQTYRAALDDVWDACTNAVRIPRWFLPVSGDLRLGGRFQLEGNAGGTIERCDPPKSFAATWEYAEKVSWIEVRLTEAADGGTRFELEHTALVDEHWEEFGPGATGVGWDMGLLGLAGHLSSTAAVDPAQAAEWLGSDEGRTFVQRSSEAWRDANVEAGTDANAAREAADRTTAAYTATE